VIVRIEALRYRSLRYVSEALGRFQMLVGPNGAGKSSFLDVVGFVGDLLRVGPLRAIHLRAADPASLTWMGKEDTFQLAVELRMPGAAAAAAGRARYEIEVGVQGGTGEVRLERETLWVDRAEVEVLKEPSAHQRALFPQPQPAPSSILWKDRGSPSGWKSVVDKIGSSGNDYFQGETSKWKSPFRLGPSKSALANLPEDEAQFPVATQVKRFLTEGIQRVVLSAEAMRKPSPPGSPKAFLPDGSNLPWVVAELRQDVDRYQAWVGHLRSALPDLRQVETVERAEDRHRYLVVVYENGLRAPSWLVSDGTLRLMALTLPAFLPKLEGALLIEEPENGIHPRAVETVYQALSSVSGAQVLCASHSPVVLGMARPEELLCFAKDQGGATDIVRGNEHPILREWKGDLDLAVLFVSGVLG